MACACRVVLRKVCLRLGRQRQPSRARTSTRAVHSRRPHSAVLLRKVSNSSESESDVEPRPISP